MNLWVRAGRALAVGSVFLAGCVGWMILLSALAGLAMVLAGGLPATTEDFVEWLGGAGFGLISIVQIGGIAAVAALLAWMLGDDGRLRKPAGDGHLRLRKAFPLWVPSKASAPVAQAGTPFDPPRLEPRAGGLWSQTAVAALGGLTVWLFPSWLAYWLMELFPDYVSTPELLTRLLMSGGWLDRAMVMLAIVVSAPILEELVFRGFLWRVAEQGFGWLGALALTTSLFAVFHFDPVQSTALLPTALFLGWLRYTSGSLLPPIAGHLANNSMGVLVTVLSPSEEATIPAWAALAGLLLTLGWSLLAWWLKRRS